MSVLPSDAASVTMSSVYSDGLGDSSETEEGSELNSVPIHPISQQMDCQTNALKATLAILSESAFQKGFRLFFAVRVFLSNYPVVSA